MPSSIARELALSAARTLLGTPPGGWGETEQAASRLKDEIMVRTWNERAGRYVTRYTTPKGGWVKDFGEAAKRWMDEVLRVEPQAPVHQGRREAAE